MEVPALVRTQDLCQERSKMRTVRVLPLRRTLTRQTCYNGQQPRRVRRQHQVTAACHGGPRRPRVFASPLFQTLLPVPRGRREAYKRWADGHESTMASVIQDSEGASRCDYNWWQ